MHGCACCSTRMMMTVVVMVVVVVTQKRVRVNYDDYAWRSKNLDTDWFEEGKSVGMAEAAFFLLLTVWQKHTLFFVLWSKNTGKRPFIYIFIIIILEKREKATLYAGRYSIPIAVASAEWNGESRRTSFWLRQKAWLDVNKEFGWGCWMERVLANVMCTCSLIGSFYHFSDFHLFFFFVYTSGSQKGENIYGQMAAG